MVKVEAQVGSLVLGSGCSLFSVCYLLPLFLGARRVGPLSNAGMNHGCD